MSWIENPDLKTLMGKRLRAARGNTTRSALCDTLDNTDGNLYTRLSKWEQGTNAVPVEAIPALCATLDCDVGYLFGEYDERTRKHADACESTGLSEEAAAGLEEPGILEAVDRLLSSPRGRACLRSIHAYITVPEAQGEISVTDTGDVVAPSVWDLGLAESDGVEIEKYIVKEERMLANYTRIGKASRLAEQAFILDIETDLKAIREEFKRPANHAYHARSITRRENRRKNKNG